MRKPKRFSSGAVVVALALSFLVGFASSVLAAPFSADPAGAPVVLEPTIPEGGGDVVLSLDDGVSETAIGDGGQFVWLNRFTPDPSEFPIELTQIQTIFGATGTAVGGAVDLVVYEDTDGDGDPGTGAVHLATYNETILANDGTSASVYILDPPVTLNGPGDVLIGLVNSYSFEGDADFPATLDQTAPQGRSWVGSYLTGDAPSPPFLPADEQWGTIDSFGFPGNWIIRGFGQTVLPPAPPVIEIPTLSTVGLGLLLALVAGAAFWFLRRQQSAG